MGRRVYGRDSEKPVYTAVVLDSPRSLDRAPGTDCKELVDDPWSAPRPTVPVSLRLTSGREDLEGRVTPRALPPP